MARQKKPYSLEACEKLLSKGYGTGVDDSYLPWVRIWSFGSEGVSSVIPGLTVRRNHELLSGLETRAFLLADFSHSVIDIREQFPLFPLDHVVALAERADISYPHISGVPCILTTDLLLTINTNDVISYVAVAVKPTAKLREKGVLDKLEIERLWWQSLGVDWILATEVDLSETVADNLIWISHEFREEEFDYSAVNISVLNSLFSKIEPRTYLIADLISLIASTLKLDVSKAKTLLCKAMWEHTLVIDLNISIQKEGIIKILNWQFNTDDQQGSFQHENIA